MSRWNITKFRWRENLISEHLLVPAPCDAESSVSLTLLPRFRAAACRLFNGHSAMLFTCRCSLMKKVWGKAADSVNILTHSLVPWLVGHSLSHRSGCFWFSFKDLNQNSLKENEEFHCHLWAVGHFQTKINLAFSICPALFLIKNTFSYFFHSLFHLSICCALSLCWHNTGWVWLVLCLLQIGHSKSSTAEFWTSLRWNWQPACPSCIQKIEQDFFLQDVVCTKNCAE